MAVLLSEDASLTAAAMLANGAVRSYSIGPATIARVRPENW
jgi:hypothetical protein